VAQTYSYDKLNRVLLAEEPSISGGQGWKRSYSYDRWGNQWVDATNSSGINVYSVTPTGSAWITPKNRINLSAGSYDRAGNQISLPPYSAAYDADNRLTTMSSTLAYAYDGEGHRVKKVNGSLTTRYVYDALGKLAAEYAIGTPPSGAPQAECSTCYLTVDHLGSTRVLWDSAGVKGRYDYMPFGDAIPSDRNKRDSVSCAAGVTACYAGSGSLTMRFTGKERDAETSNSAMGDGLDYFGARYLSSAQGRFTSPDPLMASAKVSSPQTWNRYTYGLNNPLRFTDPTGMYTCDGTKEQCEQFEKNRAAILKSKDKDAVRAARSYGKAGEKNGVNVGFADNLNDRGGTVSRTGGGLEVDPNNAGHFRATLQVTIQSDNIGNQETIAHEGSHVADYQDFVKSIDFAGNMDQSLNITHMATETRAYELSVRYAQSGNSSLNFGPCGGPGQECRFTPGMMPAQRDQLIQQLLTDPRNNYTGLNTALYPELLKPEQK
jgi:RHS repeat-associated protein